MRSRGVEKVGGEDCDTLEVVAFDDHRWTFWLSKTDHLPRKVEYLFHVNWVEHPYDQIQTEQWSDVKLNADMPNTLFAWQPPKGWREWRFPMTIEEMLKPGTMAPDFKLASTDGKPIQLSDFAASPCGSASGRLLPNPAWPPMANWVDARSSPHPTESIRNTRTLGLSSWATMPRTMPKLAQETLHANGTHLSLDSRHLRRRPVEFVLRITR